MDHQAEFKPHGELEPSDPFADTADIFADIDFNFDASNLDTQFLGFPDDVSANEVQARGPGEPVPERDVKRDVEVVPQPTPAPAPVPRPGHVAPQRYIDPRALSGVPNTTTSTTVQPRNYGPNHYSGSNGSHVANPPKTTLGFPGSAAAGYVGAPASYQQYHPQQAAQNHQWYLQYAQQQYHPGHLPQHPPPQYHPQQYIPQQHLSQQHPLQQYPPQYLPPQGSLPQQGPQLLNPMPQSQQPVLDARRGSEDDSRLSQAVSGLSATRRIKNPSSKLPEPVLIFHEPPVKRAKIGPSGETLKSGRIPRVTRKHQDRPDPREWYGPPPPKPENWGPKEKSGRPLFKYTECGELERGKMYAGKEMRQYIFGPKGSDGYPPPPRFPGAPEIKGKSRQGLTMWIGWVPAQSNERYPYGALSQKCRFADCPEARNTIRAGFPRVIFDERHNADGEAVDPFHNAGYAHLYCVEKHFDLIGAMQVADIRLDQRDFKREENLSKLSRQFPDIQDTAEAWYVAQQPRYMQQQLLGGSRKWKYSDTLSYCLVKHALDNLPEIRAKVREDRAGADISKHMGDLMVQRFLADCRQNNLLDEAGNPVPNAREQMLQISARKRFRSKRPISRAPSTNSGVASSYSLASSAAQDYDKMLALAASASASASSLQPQWPGLQFQPAYFYPQEQMPCPVVEIPPQIPQPAMGNTAQKRTIDTMLADDWEVDNQATAEEKPAKMPRIEESVEIDRNPSTVVDPPVKDADELQVTKDPEASSPVVNVYNSVEAGEPSPGLEPEPGLDLDAGLDMIDNEMFGEPPSEGREPSVGTLDDLPVADEDDLFGDGKEPTTTGDEASPNVSSRPDE
ncbi:hypothetical protein GGR52DRAFT_232254 [Hypoxylon sp. FL1284]|nr:hypothetical protein GGR52DRAFT_232254 [Hypoxylon sp. FL1284]